jgi:hypothetical protein
MKRFEHTLNPLTIKWIDYHFFYWISIMDGMMVNMFNLMVMTIWIYTSIFLCVLNEVMGNDSPRLVKMLYMYVLKYQDCRGYRCKHRNKYKKGKPWKYSKRITVMLPIMYAMSASQAPMVCAMTQRVPVSMTMEVNQVSHEHKIKHDSTIKWHRDDYELTVTNQLRFETDSVPIKVDNCCTQSITGFIEDFVPGTQKEVIDKQVRGFGNTINKITKQGTIKWTIYDDEGKEQDIIVANSYYFPGCGIRLLSPQHWEQERRDNYPLKDGTRCVTYYDRIILQWNQRNTIKTIHIDAAPTNVATMWTKGSLATYDRTTKIISMNNEVQQGESASLTVPPSVENGDSESRYSDCDTDKLNNYQHLGQEQVVIRGATSSSTKGITPEEELMQWHVRFGHIPMSRIQSLDAEGVLPKRLSICRVPICAGCMYGKLTRQPWKTKGATSHIAAKATQAGECVSVNQMISTVPSLIAQMKGIPTWSRYQIATVFVDHYSDYTFVHFQSSATSIETTQAKHEYERHAAGAGLTIKRYHADNGRLVDNMWTNDMKLKNQYITLCWVNAHHQNGKVEKRIRDLQEIARTALIHASTRWPDAVNRLLWPYALCKAAVDMNTIKHKDAELSPLERSANTKVMFHPRHHHSFGCPMYVLDGRLQSGSMMDRWETRARLAVHLGPSLNHANNVSLAMSLTTGLVSPMFHAKYDDTFETVSQSYGRYVRKSQWQVKCGFVKEGSVLPINSVRDQFYEETNDQTKNQQ